MRGPGEKTIKCKLQQRGIFFFLLAIFLFSSGLDKKHGFRGTGLGHVLVVLLIAL